jgi:eukaryotic-like serine/threonine-protein kinase
MDVMPRPGQVLRMTRAGALLHVAERIGEGGQGVVHRARLNGTPFAVKWFRPGPRDAELHRSITALVRRGRPPHPAFVWPIDLVTADHLPGFGYVMPLLEPRFLSLAQLLNRHEQPPFRVMTALGRELVDAFAALHSAGLCYRDVNFGNLRVDPQLAEVAIIDNDNVGTDGGDVFVKGTGPFMAPEILRDEALPSTVTDLHSLAVLLFYLFVHGHPLLGARADSMYTWESGGHVSESELMVRNLGERPLFVFDPDDASNRPVPGDRMLIWWDIYPDFLRQVFTQAFSSGLADASLQGRVTEGIWRRALTRLSDSVTTCPRCTAAVFHDPDNHGRPCWSCHAPLPVPQMLKLPGGTLVLCEGAAVTSHHLARDRDHRTVRATVEPHPADATRLILRNQTDQPWRVLPEGEDVKTVGPGQRLAVRPMTIAFQPGIRGRIE